MVKQFQILYIHNIKHIIIFSTIIYLINSLSFPFNASSDLYLKYLSLNKNALNYSEIYENILQNKIISSFNLGDHTQNISILFNSDEELSYLSDNTDSILNYSFLNLNYLYLNTSKTFTLNSYVEFKYKNNFIMYYVEDKLTIQNKTIDFNYFIKNNHYSEVKIEKQINIFQYYLNIGLGLEYKQNNMYPKFMPQLIKNGIISYYNWFINYKTNNIILSIDENISDYKNSIVINAKTFFDKNKNETIIDWDIPFDEVYSSINETDKLVYQHSIESFFLQGNLNINSGFIIGTSRYRLILNEILFDDLVNEEKCVITNYNLKYYIYVCKSSYKDELKKNFKVIKFYSNLINYTFELNYEDLFIEINDENILFLVAFEIITPMTSNYYRWILGEPFLKKYNFIFNIEKKTIMFINNMNKEDNISYKSLVVKITIIILLIIIILAIIILVIICYKKKSNKKDENKEKGKRIIDDDVNNEKYNEELKVIN